MTEELSKKIAELYVLYGGSISAIARDTNLARSTVRENLAKQGLGKKPLASGTVEGVIEKRDVGRPDVRVAGRAGRDAHAHAALATVPTVEGGIAPFSFAILPVSSNILHVIHLLPIC